jgi:hypothetical protein
MANVTFTPNPQPEPACYPSDVNALLTMLTTGGGISGTIPDNSGGGIYVGASPPDSSLTNKVWYKIDAAGRPLGVFMFYNGNWRKVYTGAIIGEIRLYIGSSAAFDTTGLGIVGGDLDGWALCNGNNGTLQLHNFFPLMSSGYDAFGVAGWYGNPNGFSQPSAAGGLGNWQIQDNHLPQLRAHGYYESFTTASGSVGTPNVLVCDASKPMCALPVEDVNTNQPVGGQAQIDNTPPWVAMAPIMFVGYA